MAIATTSDFDTTFFIDEVIEEAYAMLGGQAELANVNVQVQGGALESSNVNPLSEMTDMIALQRQFEMHLKLMKTAEEIDASSSSLLRAF